MLALSKVAGSVLLVYAALVAVMALAQRRLVYFPAAREPKTFLEIPGAGHNDMNLGNPLVLKTAGRFIAGLPGA